VKTRYPLYRRLGGPQGAENLAPTRIQSPDRPVAILTALSQSTVYVINKKENVQMFSMHMEMAGNLRQETNSISDNITAMFIKR